MWEMKMGIFELKHFSKCIPFWMQLSSFSTENSDPDRINDPFIFSKHHINFMDFINWITYIELKKSNRFSLELHNCLVKWDFCYNTLYSYNTLVQFSSPRLLPYFKISWIFISSCINFGPVFQFSAFNFWVVDLFVWLYALSPITSRIIQFRNMEDVELPYFWT